MKIFYRSSINLSSNLFSCTFFYRLNFSKFLFIENENNFMKSKIEI